MSKDAVDPGDDRRLLDPAGYGRRSRYGASNPHVLKSDEGEVSSARWNTTLPCDPDCLKRAESLSEGLKRPLNEAGASKFNVGWLERPRLIRIRAVMGG